MDEHRNAPRYAYANGHAYATTYAYTAPHAHTYRHAYATTYAYTAPHAYANRHAYTAPHAHANRHAHAPATHSYPGTTHTPTSTRTPRPTGTPWLGTVIGVSTPAQGSTWRIRSVDSMKLSRDTLKTPLTQAQIADVVRLDAGLHVNYVTVDVYNDDPSYQARWVRAIRAAGLHVWFRGEWYAWEDHQVGLLVHGQLRTATVRGGMSPQAYIAATRRFLEQHAALVENGDVFDFCPEPENGAYWMQRYGKSWSWRNPIAKRDFNSFLQSGISMVQTILARQGRGAVLVTAISVDSSIATRLFSASTVQGLGVITLDLYPEGFTEDPAVATSRLLAEVEQVHRRWAVPVLIGEHGYARDFPVDDATQARVLAAELTALRRLPYIVGLNYWVDAGGPGYGGFTNLYRRVGGAWQPRPAAAVLAAAYAVS